MLHDWGDSASTGQWFWAHLCKGPRLLNSVAMCCPHFWMCSTAIRPGGLSKHFVVAMCLLPLAKFLRKVDFQTVGVAAFLNALANCSRSSQAHPNRSLRLLNWKCAPFKSVCKLRLPSFQWILCQLLSRCVSLRTLGRTIFLQMKGRRLERIQLCRISTKSKQTKFLTDSSTFMKFS